MLVGLSMPVVQNGEAIFVEGTGEGMACGQEATPETAPAEEPLSIRIA
jgi:hypothetical protein